MTPKYSMGQTLFNRNTKEKGTVGRIYESDGVTMYEVRIPVGYQGLVVGSNVSDWAEDVLDLDQGFGSARNRFFAFYPAPSWETRLDVAAPQISREYSNLSDT